MDISHLLQTFRGDGVKGVLTELLNAYGPTKTLLTLVAVVFAETGLLVGFFLPGDSLLVTAGVFSTPNNPTQYTLNVGLMIAVLSLAAIVGDTVGFWFGRKAGTRLFSREDSLFFSHKHLQRTHDFYERHGGKTIIIARFMPIVRTFAPVVAGIGRMNYRRFVIYNVVGAILWVVSMTMLGYGLATAYPQITKQIDKLIVVIVFLSILPGIISALRTWLRNRNATVAS